MLGSINLVAKQLAKDKGISEEMALKVLRFYFKKVKNSLTDGEETSIYIKNLGTIIINERGLRYFIRKKIEIIKRLRVNTTIDPQKREVYITSATDDLRILLKQLNKHRLNKKNYNEARIDNKTRKLKEKDSVNSEGILDSAI